MIYKRGLFILFCVLTSILLTNSCIKADSFTLDVQVKGAKDSESIFLSYLLLQGDICYKVIDTAKLINGKCLFIGKINEITPAEVFFDNICSVRIYLEPTNMKLLIDKNNSYDYSFTGTSIDQEIIELKKVVGTNQNLSNSQQLRINDITDRINQLPENENTKRDSLFNIFLKFRDECIANSNVINKKSLDFIREHKDYQIIPDLLFLFLPDSLYIKDVTELFETLPEKSKNSFMGKLLYMKINETLTIKDSYVGGSAPDFIRKDLFKNTIKLSDYRNQSFVLLDFWASWCIPCLEGMPAIKDLYENYNKKGLTIIGISSDKDKTQWTDAIKKHELNKWTQVLSQETENIVFDNIGKNYNIAKIPCYVLIDKQGKVIAKWEHLGEKELSEIDRVLKGNISNLQ